MQALLKNSTILNSKLDGANAWTAETLPPGTGHVDITDGCIQELDGLIGELRRNPLPLPALRPDDFELPECRRLMLKARHYLDEGPGFVLIDRFPLDRWKRADAEAAYWLLCSMIERPVAQKWDGTMIYDVRDTGKKPENWVRPDITNVKQNFHTDNSYNRYPP